jgi:putative acetyltransferase
MTKEFNVQVRRAEDHDFPAIADAHQASILELGGAYYDPQAMQFWGRKRDPDGYRDARDQHGEIFFVAEQAERPGYLLGFSSYRYEENRHRLQGFYVRGTASRQGVGTRLLATVEDHAKAAGADELHVEASLPGEKFYLARGFRELSRHAKPVKGTDSSMTALTMVKLLRP